VSIFGDLEVQLDPWQVEYGAELPLDDAEQPAPDEAVILDVEVASEKWQPIRPSETTLPAELFFVDGVRRIEARLMVRRQERLCHGASVRRPALGASSSSDLGNRSALLCRSKLTSYTSR
jgi:hypothetical protein